MSSGVSLRRFRRKLALPARDGSPHGTPGPLPPRTPEIAAPQDPPPNVQHREYVGVLKMCETARYLPPLPRGDVALGANSSSLGSRPSPGVSDAPLSRRRHLRSTTTAAPARTPSTPMLVKVWPMPAKIVEHFATTGRFRSNTWLSFGPTLPQLGRSSPARPELAAFGQKLCYGSHFSITSGQLLDDFRAC